MIIANRTHYATVSDKEGGVRSSTVCTLSYDKKKVLFLGHWRKILGSPSMGHYVKAPGGLKTVKIIKASIP